MEIKGAQNSQNNFEKKNRVGGFIVPYFGPYYKDVKVIKMVGSDIRIDI